MKKLLLATAVAALFAGAANAQDGTLGTTSTGGFEVTATVVPMVRISGLDDISLTIDPATLASNFGTTNGRTQFCVFSNVDATGAYNVRVLGSAPGDNANPYGLAGATSGTQLNHTVGFYDAAAYNSIAATFMRPSTQRASMNTRAGQARATTTDCSANGLGGANASINVGIRNSVAIAALADTYAGDLTVVVSVP